MKKYLSFATMFLLFITMCFSQITNQSEYEKNVLAFNAQGIKLGDSYTAFKSKFPDAIFMSSSSDDYKKCYTVSSIPNVTVALFYFFDNKLFEIRYGYDVSQVNKLGGWDAMAENFVKKYGRFSYVDSKDRDDIIFNGYTNYYSINRYVEFNVQPKILLFIFSDTDLSEKMRQKKMNSMDYGF